MGNAILDNFKFVRERGIDHDRLYTLTCIWLLTSLTCIATYAMLKVGKAIRAWAYQRAQAQVKPINVRLARQYPHRLTWDTGMMIVLFARPTIMTPRWFATLIWFAHLNAAAARAAPRVAANSNEAI